ncbi:MAG: radical SAM protein [Acidobacteriales bacterium]|nr:radical SAM protein [Terriglobales bacterium]
MRSDQQHATAIEEKTVFRVNARIHDVLMGGAKPAPLTPRGEPATLPEPVFPMFPELAGDVEPDPRLLPQGESPYRTSVTPAMVRRALRGWLYPYIRSRLLPGDFQPLIAYLFTEWKCNLDCHYCWAFNNQVSGMTEDTARRSIDWLHDTGCRVLALMGGEVLLRPRFAHKVVYYAAKKGFWVYVPTNGRLMRKEVIDWLGDAGVATVNLAVDSLEDRKELPKSLNPIRPYFDYLIKKQYVYGFSVFFNINITRINLEDVRRLTEIAHDVGIATDYHINESPMLEQTTFKHFGANNTFITPEDWPKIDETVDWLIEKNRSGYKMVNSVRRLLEMKAFMRGKLQHWNCRAGQNSLIIRTDGTLAPCFPMYPATHDWGTVENPHFNGARLAEIKQGCQPQCFSTLNHNLSYCYDASRAIRWTLKQAMRGFQGTTGSFED